MAACIIFLLPECRQNGAPSLAAWQHAIVKDYQETKHEVKPRVWLQEFSRGFGYSDSDIRAQPFEQSKLADGFYDQTPVLEQKRLTEEEAALTATIDALVAEWERIEADLGPL